jgi:hypothetical protein
MFEVEDIRFPYYETDYFTRENLNRLFNTDETSPPMLGNIVTVFAHKK